jgi:cytochrome c553
LKRPIRCIVSVSTLLSAAFAASAQGAPDASSLRLRSLAATCAQCHGTDGRAVAGATVPPLAGRPAAFLTEQMNAFKNGARQGTVMPQLAKGYDDAQIARLADYFAGLKAEAVK